MMKTKADMDNHANQLNPNSKTFKKMRDNRANQLNPNNKAYWKVRGSKGNSTEK